jgi:hypothetical protein
VGLDHSYAELTPPPYNFTIRARSSWFVLCGRDDVGWMVGVGGGDGG